MTVPYVIPPTAVAGFGLSAADWNSKVRDSLENVAKPPRCRINRTTAQAVSHASITNVVWVNEEYDTDNFWTPGATADRFIIPAGMSGWYRVIFNAQFAINGAGARHLAILYNGVGIATMNNGGHASWYVGGCVTADHYMTAGSYVAAMAYQSSGVVLNIDPAYNINFSICQIAR